MQQHVANSGERDSTSRDDVGSDQVEVAGAGDAAEGITARSAGVTGDDVVVDDVVPPCRRSAPNVLFISRLLKD
jgi:hypothetical protein